MSLRVVLLVLCACALSSAEDDVPHTRFRDKRTLDFILHGLAQLLGYRLERGNSTASLVSTPAPIATTSPRIVLVVNNEKHKQDAQNHFRSDRIQNGDFNYFRSDPHRDRNHDKINNNFNFFKTDTNRDKHQDKIKNDDFNYFKSDFSHERPYHGGVNTNSKSYQSFISDRDNLRKHYEFGENYHKNDDLDKKGNNRNKANRDRVNDYLERVSYYLRNQLKDNKNSKSSNNENQNHRKEKENEKDVDFNIKNDHSFEHFGKLEDLTENIHKLGDESPSKYKEKDESKLETINNSQKCNNNTAKESKSEQEHQNHNEKPSGETIKQSNVQLQDSQKNKEQTNQHGLSNNDKNYNAPNGNYYFNQIPAPSLQNWEHDFWNNQYTNPPNNPYNFQIPDFNIDGSTLHENKEFHKPSEFSFHGTEQNNPLPDHSYPRSQYSENHDFEPLHDWDASSDAISEKPQQPKEQSASANNQNSQEKKDLPMPDHSTVKPKLAELIHEIEGTKQNPLWPPPPFDQAFEGTDSSIKSQSNSPLVLNLYNYTSVSDYLLDVSKKELQQNSSNSENKSPASYIAVVVPSKVKDKETKKEAPQPSFYGILYPQQESRGDKKQVNDNELQPKKTPRLQEQETKYFDDNYYANLGLYYRDFYNYPDKSISGEDVNTRGHKYSEN